MKTLYSCGCSFMSLDSRSNRIRSFLDIYCEQKGFKHVSLARSGATNFLIRLQIEEAIKQNADYIVISATTNDRMDIPIHSRESDIQHPVTLRDIEYKGYHSQSVNNVVTDPKIISDSINNWTTDNYRDVGHNNYKRTEITQGQITAMKHYVAELHNFMLEQQKDYYILSDGLRKLMSLNKQFIFARGPMYCDWKFVGNRLWADENNLAQPWDVPFGTTSETVNHSPQQAHDLFVQNLIKLTPTWTT